MYWFRINEIFICNNTFAKYTFGLVSEIHHLWQMLTLGAKRFTFTVITMENSLGKRSQFTKSWEAGKLIDASGLRNWTPLAPADCFTRAPGTTLEVSLSRTKDRRSKGSNSEDSRQIKRPERRSVLCYEWLEILQKRSSETVWNPHTS